MNASILVVDDDRFLSEAIRKLLDANGYAVRLAGSAEEALEAIGSATPDLLVLDLGLPDQDGVSLCRRLRLEHRFPILMLTSRNTAMDKVVGLEVGADDYLTKPFDHHELVARVRAQLRRASEYGKVAEERGSIIEAGGLQVDETSRTASVNGRQLELTELEFKLLSYLAHNKGRALGREALFETIWGYELEFNSNSLEVMVYRLRQKIEKDGGPKVIHTLRGFGYKLEAL
jgi:DNA-binding response OmpR family regulator